MGPIPFKDGLGREVVLRQASLSLIVVRWCASQCQQARARMHGSHWLVEHKWNVGPIPFKDGLGREVVLRQASLSLIVVFWYASRCQQARARMHGSHWLEEHEWTVGPITFKNGLGREVVLRQASQPASPTVLLLKLESRGLKNLTDLQIKGAQAGGARVDCGTHSVQGWLGARGGPQASQPVSDCCSLVCIPMSASKSKAAWVTLAGGARVDCGAHSVQKWPGSQGCSQASQPACLSHCPAAET